MNRFKDIFAKNIAAHELKDCEGCDTKETCDHLPKPEDFRKQMDETNPINKDSEMSVIFVSLREWYKEKTGEELTD